MLCTAIFLLVGLRFSHPPLRVCGFQLFPRRTQTRKKRTLRVERIRFLRTCTCHACADMYFYLCSSTCLRLSLVLGIFSISGTNFEDEFFSFPFSPFRKGRNFYRETMMVDDFSNGDFPVRAHHFLLYIYKLT